jgi:hypothetical protein
LNDSVYGWIRWLELDIGILGTFAKFDESLVCGDAVDDHQDALDLFDHRTLYEDAPEDVGYRPPAEPRSGQEWRCGLSHEENSPLAYGRRRVRHIGECETLRPGTTDQNLHLFERARRDSNP